MVGARDITGVMTPTVYVYERCGTCRKALKWLDAHGIAYEAIPIVDRPPSAATLKALWERSGLPLKRFFNTAGQSYRAGGFSKKLPTMSAAKALAALAADGKLIKRPLVDGGDFVLVGFDEEAYAEAFKRTA